MNRFENTTFVGERALFMTNDAIINNVTFMDGESPLKESKNLNINHSEFKWKYPLWYCQHVEVNDSTLFDTARSGIWYTEYIKMVNCHILAPKTFRRSKGITLINCQLDDAKETFWSCKDVKLENVTANGDYFGMNSENVEIDRFILNGNYAFDGAKHIIVRNAKMESKDSFWNCEDVVVYDSYINGEYFGWNSKNITLINCTVSSKQGFCYMKNVKLINCRLINTTLCFEFCENIDAEITTSIDSLKNPISGHIKAKEIKELILDENIINPKNTIIEVMGDEI